MARTRLITIFGLAILFVGLVAVFVRVLELRFSTGDIYPHYSTLRSDPLGAMALYEAFESTDGFEVSRNHDHLMAIDTLDGDTALILCGLARQSFGRLRAPGESPALQAVRNEGARLVMVINPELVPSKYDLEDKEEEKWWKRRQEFREKRQKESADDAEDSAEIEAREKETESELEKLREEFESTQEEQNGPRLTEAFEVDISSPESFERPESGWELEPGEGAPKVLPFWFSQYRFTDLGDPWTVIASVDGDPVVVERPFGKGTIALTSDAYFASNEALWLGADTPFLLWLTGGKPKLIFDETIHGSTETGGVVKLIRQFRLHGFFVGLLIFVVLLAWKSGASLTPGNESIERGLVGGGGAVAGEETDSGLVRLLRRSIRPKELIAQCLQVHRGSSGASGDGPLLRREHSGQAAAIDRVVARHRERPGELGALEAYRQITRILSQPDAYRRESARDPAADSPPSNRE